MAGVVLSGYYGFGNSGDEAVLYSIISQLRETDPTVAVTVLSNQPELTSCEYGVHAVNRWRLRAVVRAIRDSSLLISGGGSLLQDVTGIRSIIYYLGIVFLAKLYGKPVMFYAQGIGPVSTWLGRTLTRTVVNRVDTVSVRDPRSAEELAQMGVTRPPVRVTADPVFALEPSSEDIESAGDVLSGCGLRSGLNADSLVGLSLRDWPGCADLKAAAARVCDDLVVDGKQVIFIPMHFPGDVKVSLEVASMMRQPAAVLDK